MKNTLQTLDRGITALDLISRSDHGVTVARIAEELEINRSVAYRIITTPPAQVSSPTHSEKSGTENWCDSFCIHSSGK